jgi:hypothetical protein
MRLTVLALCALAWLGCGVLDRKVEPSAQPEPAFGTIVYDDFAPGIDVHAPLFSALRGPHVPQRYKTLRLLLDLDRRIPFNSHVSVELRLPAGVSLRNGQTRVQVGPNARPQHDQLRFDLDVGELPSKDLVVVVDARGKSFGYHAEHPYRFGRPPPVPLAPALSGPELRVAGKSYGRSVVIK